MTEMSELLDIYATTVKKWHKLGLLRGMSFNRRNEHLYERPDTDQISEEIGKNMEYRRIKSNLLLDRQHEVQYET